MLTNVNDPLIAHSVLKRSFFPRSEIRGSFGLTHPDPWIKDPKLDSRDPGSIDHKPNDPNQDPNHSSNIITCYNLKKHAENRCHLLLFLTKPEFTRTT